MCTTVTLPCALNPLDETSEINDDGVVAGTWQQQQLQQLQTASEVSDWHFKHLQRVHMMLPPELLPVVHWLLQLPAQFSQTKTQHTSFRIHSFLCWLLFSLAQTSVWFMKHWGLAGKVIRDLNFHYFSNYWLVSHQGCSRCCTVSWKAQRKHNRSECMFRNMLQNTQWWTVNACMYIF